MTRSLWARGLLAWVERPERWNAGLAAGDTEGLWGLWREAAESWLVGWAGREDPACCGRGRMRRIRRLPAEGQRGPVGLGEVGRRAQGWLKAWRWLQDLSRAVSLTGPVAELKVQRLVALLAGCLPGIGGHWEERQLLVPGAAPEQLEEWAREAEREFLRVQAEDAAERQAAWHKWVTGAVKVRPGLLYRWVKGEAQAPKVATTVDGRWTLDPSEVVEGTAALWGPTWRGPLGGEAATGPGSGPAGWRDAVGDCQEDARSGRCGG